MHQMTGKILIHCNNAVITLQNVLFPVSLIMSHVWLQYITPVISKESMDSLIRHLEFVIVGDNVRLHTW